MPLKEEFEGAGNWLFRWRSYLPLLLIVLALAGMKDFKPIRSEWVEESWEFGCMLFSFFGLFIRVLTVGYKPKGTSGGNTREQEADVLNTTGTYSVVRHPLYLGNCIIWIGISLFFCRWWMVLNVVLIFWLYYERIMFAEEEFLRRKFGEAYVEWASRTPAFIPRFRNFRPWESEFSWKKVLGKEYAGFFAIIMAFCALEIIGEYVGKGRFELDAPWKLVLAFGTVLYLTLRVLKKYTGVLTVPDR